MPYSTNLLQVLYMLRGKLVWVVLRRKLCSIKYPLTPRAQKLFKCPLSKSLKLSHANAEAFISLNL